MIKFSFLIITYNQERYILEALKSAVNQDYPMLEIIVSDDNSSDRTFEIATDFAKNYNGPFKIVLNQNKTNLGIGRNFQKAYSLSSGDWLVMAAGDDISYPQRCKLLEAVIQGNQDILGVGSYREVIDGDGISQGYSIWNDVVHGATGAWHRRVFESFPEISERTKSEDLLLYFRVFLLGGKVAQLKSVTIKYRMDGHSVSNTSCDTLLSEKQDRLKKALYILDIMYERMDNLLNMDNFQYKDILRIHIQNKINKLKRSINLFNRSVALLCSGNLFKKMKVLLFTGIPYLSLVKTFLLSFVSQPISKVSLYSELVDKDPSNGEIEIVAIEEFLHGKDI